MIAIAGKKAFQSIQAVLRQDKSEVRLSDLWRAIHDELTIGVRLPGGVLRLDAEDRRRLREYIRGLHGLDPLLDELDGDRVELAARTSNEKFSAQSVFGRFLRLVSRRPEIHLTYRLRLDAARQRTDRRSLTDYGRIARRDGGCRRKRRRLQPLARRPDRRLASCGRLGHLSRS